MPGNNFEKRVQEKMEEFRLRPGEPVWENIEQEIRREKKRRRVFILIPLFLGLLLIGYGGYKFIGTGKKNQVSKNDNSKNNLHSEPINDNQAKQETPDSKEVGPTDKKNEIVESKKHNQVIKPSKSLLSSIPPKKYGLNPLVKRTEKIKDNKVVQNNNLGSPTQSNTAEIKAENPSIQTVTNEIKDKKEAAVTRKNERTVPTIGEQKDSTEKKHVEELVNAPQPKEEKLTATNTPKKERKKSSSAFSISFAGGLSDVRNQNSGKNSNSGVIVGVPQGPDKALTESKSDFAYKLGVNWEIKLGKKLKFLTGLDYAYYSYQRKVGVQISAPLQFYSADFGNQSVNGYFGGPLQQNFINKYHFIEIPATIRWQLNNSRKIIVGLDAGFSLARLVSSNALVYDTASGGVSFYSRRLLTKNHFNLIAGLNVGWKRWTIGPRISYDLTHNFKGTPGRNQYLKAGYLELRYRFKEK